MLLSGHINYYFYTVILVRLVISGVTVAIIINEACDQFTFFFVW